MAKLLYNHLENNYPLLSIQHLRIGGISKEYNSINLELKRGEIHGIMGESGAGKSGIAHVLVGMIRPEQGSILIKNQSVEIKSPLQSATLGIGVLFQNITYSFIPHLTVQEYLHIWSGSFLISNKKLTEKTLQLLNEYEINVNPYDFMFELSLEECRLLSLMKILALKPLIVVLDEPSSDLSEVKKQHLFRVIRKYAETGCGILYLSNKLDEILQISDRVTILKDGGTVDSFPIEYAKKNPKTLLGLYFGREDAYESSNDEFKEVVDTILHTTELLTSEYELHDLLNLLVEKIAETFKADGCNILLLDDSSMNVMEKFRHLSPGMPMVELNDEVVRDVILNRKQLIINYIDEREMPDLFHQPNNIKALACIPIRVRTKISGAIEVFFTQRKGFSQEDIELLMTFATQVAIVIENTRLLGRSTLLKEAHHRIKNNLQSIISLLILQLQTKSTKSLESIVWQIIDRIKTIASVHEILSRDEEGAGLINFQNLVKLIIANFQEKEQLNRITVDYSIEDLYVSYRTATSLGLVINELLANCFEHAFPNGQQGKITLSLDCDENQIHFTIIDNGVGFSNEGLNSSNTLGLSLVKTLVTRDLRGSVEINGKLGTKVYVTVPKKQINY